MKHHMRTPLVAIALVASAASLTACGSKDDDPQAGATATAVETTATQTQIATTPPPKVDPEKATWAKAFCGALSEGTKPVTPPDMQGTSPADTQASIVTFFTTVSERQDAQLKAFETAGPPPGPNAKRDWRKARTKLESVHKSIEGLVTKVKGEDAKTPADVQKLVSQLGTSLKEFGTYQGPAIDLTSSKSLGDAIKQEPSCAATS